MLADAIRKHPVLYAKPSNVRFKSVRPEKEPDAWNQISDELNLEVDSCKSLWSCIKQKFIKYRKKLDNGETFTKEWPTYESLHGWLDEHIKKRRTRNDIFKQIRVPLKNGKLIAVNKASPNSSTCNENEYLDDVESAEWNELTDERDESPVKGKNISFFSELSATKISSFKSFLRSNAVETATLIIKNFDTVRYAKKEIKNRNTPRYIGR